MFIVNAIIAGGAAYAGVKTYLKHQPKRSDLWLNDPSSQRDGPTLLGRNQTSAEPSETEMDAATLEEKLLQQEKRVGRDFVVSSISLSLSMSGLLFYPPLGVASVPFTVYTLIPSLEKSFEVLFKKTRGKLTVVRAAAVIWALTANRYFWASAIDWTCQYFTLIGRRMRNFQEYLPHELINNYREYLNRHFGEQPQSAWVLVNGVEIETPIDELTVGNVLVVNPGEFVPVEGRIVEGNASVNAFISTGDSRSIEIGAGDPIPALTLVKSGRVFVRVEKIED